MRNHLYRWRREIKAKLYPKARWGPRALLSDDTIELLASTGPFATSDRLHATIGRGWERWDILGEDLFASLEQAFQAEETRTKRRGTQSIVSQSESAGKKQRPNSPDSDGSERALPERSSRASTPGPSRLPHTSNRAPRTSVGVAGYTTLPRHTLRPSRSTPGLSDRATQNGVPSFLPPIPVPLAVSSFIVPSHRTYEQAFIEQGLVLPRTFSTPALHGESHSASSPLWSAPPAPPSTPQTRLSLPVYHVQSLGLADPVTPANPASTPHYLRASTSAPNLRGLLLRDANHIPSPLSGTPYPPLRHLDIPLDFEAFHTDPSYIDPSTNLQAMPSSESSILPDTSSSPSNRASHRYHPYTLHPLFPAARR